MSVYLLVKEFSMLKFLSCKHLVGAILNIFSAHMNWKQYTVWEFFPRWSPNDMIKNKGVPMCGFHPPPYRKKNLFTILPLSEDHWIPSFTILVYLIQKILVGLRNLNISQRTLSGNALFSVSITWLRKKLLESYQVCANHGHPCARTHRGARWWSPPASLAYVPVLSWQHFSALPWSSSTLWL